MLSTVENQVLAFAGIVQACYGVNKLAKSGQVPPSIYDPLMHSLFEFDPASVSDVYQGVATLRPGLDVLVQILEGRDASRFGDTLRYLMAAIHLESKLKKDTERLKIIRSRLDHVSFRAENFEPEWRDLAASISAIYQDTLSTMSFRIQVTGNVSHLQDEAVAAQVRCLLLAAIRSALLWRQVGGRRWHLLLKRRAILATARQLLQAM